jgi:hypothetical protein
VITAACKPVFRLVTPDRTSGLVLLRPCIFRDSITALPTAITVLCLTTVKAMVTTTKVTAEEDTAGMDMAGIMGTGTMGIAVTDPGQIRMTIKNTRISAGILR